MDAHQLAGVLTWPGDEISDDFLAALRKEVEPAYNFIDCKGTGDKNAGVFILRSERPANDSATSS